jgi:hypothetical protein
LRPRPFAAAGYLIPCAGAALLALSLLVFDSGRGAVTAVSLLVLGVVLVALGRATPRSEPSLAALLARCGEENTRSLLRELGVSGGAAYFPASMCGGVPRAAVALRELDAAALAHGQPARRLSGLPGDGPVAFVAAPGSFCLELLDCEVGPELDDASSALTTIACGTLGLAAHVSIGERGPLLEVAFGRVAAPVRSGHDIVDETFGSPLASIAGTVLAEALQRPVTVEAERSEGDRLTVVLSRGEDGP